MDTFVARHAHSVTSTLSGFDRIVFRGTLQLLVQNRGMHMFLGRAKVLLLDFKKYALGDHRAPEERRARRGGAREASHPLYRLAQGE